MTSSDIKNIESILKYKFTQKALLEQAFTHISYANTFGVESNERLEFLGDTVLGFIISERIFHDKDYREGELSKLRARLVSQKPLASLVDKLNLSKYLKTTSSHDAVTESMKADLMESIIGAMYLDSNLKTIKNFVLGIFENLIKKTEKLNVLNDNKSILQEKFKNKKIKYTFTKVGSDHDPTYTVRVYIDNILCGTGTGKTKRDAEQLSAKAALNIIKKV